MTRRLMFAPLVGCGLFTAGLAWGWFSGMAWPVASQAALYVRRRPVTAATEGDGIG